MVFDLDESMDLINIKRCPFCGYLPTLVCGIDGHYYVGCFNIFCEIQPQTMTFVTPEDALEIWLRRK